MPARMRARWPETFGDEVRFPDAVLQEAIDISTRHHDEGTWGAELENATLTWAAHLAIVGSQGESSGLSSASAGSESVNFSDALGKSSVFRDLYGTIVPRGVAAGPRLMRMLVSG